MPMSNGARNVTSNGISNHDNHNVKSISISFAESG